MIKKIIRRIIRWALTEKGYSIPLWDDLDLINLYSIKGVKDIYGQRGYFSDNLYVQGKVVLKDGDPINIADIFPDAQAKITGAINESDLTKALQSVGTDKFLTVPDNPPNLDLALSTLRDALRGADGRTLTDLYNKLGSISGSVSVANFPTDYPDSGTHTRLDDLKQALQSIGTDKFLTVPDNPSNLDVKLSSRASETTLQNIRDRLPESLTTSGNFKIAIVEDQLNLLKNGGTVNVGNFPTDYPDNGTHTRLDDLKQALQSVGADKLLTAPDNPPNLDLPLSALRGTDNRDLSQLYNALRGRGVREYYIDDFLTNDTWLWNVEAGGTVENGKLILSNKQRRITSRYYPDNGSIISARMSWGIKAQAGAFRRFGFGSPDRIRIWFEMRDSSVYAGLVFFDKTERIDITSLLPSDYDSALHYYYIVIDRGVARFFVDLTLVAEIPLPRFAPFANVPQVGISLRNDDLIAGDMIFDHFAIAYFTPREDFVPTNQIIKSFAGSVGGGTGYTTSWSYTVPEGKRAIIEVAEALSDDDTTDGVFASVEVDVGGTRLHLVQAGMRDGVACGTKDIKTGRILLLPGQTVYGTYQNASASSHYLSCKAVITELE